MGLNSKINNLRDKSSTHFTDEEMETHSHSMSDMSNLSVVALECIFLLAEYYSRVTVVYYQTTPHFSI